MRQGMVSEEWKEEAHKAERELRGKGRDEEGNNRGERVSDTGMWIG